MRRLLVWTLAAGMVLMAGGQQAMARKGMRIREKAPRR